MLLFCVFLRPSYSFNLTDLRDATDAAIAKRQFHPIDGQPTRNAIDEAAEDGFEAVKELVEVKEPLLYKLGLFLDRKHPAGRVAAFSEPSEGALEIARLGLVSVETSKRLKERYPENAFRRSHGGPSAVEDRCPTVGRRRCPTNSKKYRTADGSCNNPQEPWKGSSMMPLQRFLSPRYADGIQEPRLSVLGRRLPSARKVSTTIHRDVDLQMSSITLMFMQWGQFLDHDLIGSAQSRGFNGSIPQCCQSGGVGFLPPHLLHPACLPIEVPPDDRFFAPFGVRCLEFARSAPTTSIDCNLGWREQINQVTSFVDASNIYGSDQKRADAVRLFERGMLRYGRNGDELCRSSALTTDCFVTGDGRAGEQPGLTAFHTVWLRFHNLLASELQKLNPHWNDERLYQEARKIVGALVQHITYKEFLPLLLGTEVMDLFELNPSNKGYFEGYNSRVDPAIANSFASAAFRFGHSLVQNSFLRTDSQHRFIFNNVSLHREQDNLENIWSAGSTDRLLLGFCNQPSQRRDEFVADELTNHLFQPQGLPFGADLAAINVQRGRDHGIPAYTVWREPCGLTPVKTWKDLEGIMSVDTVRRFASIFGHVDDVDLFSGGLAEKPVRGGIVGPVFACIIAQQFLNLRKGDRFWYENPEEFAADELEQIRKVTFAQVLCRTMERIVTVQPFVFLSPDDSKNARLRCDDPFFNSLDLTVWTDRDDNAIDDSDVQHRQPRARKKKKRKNRTTTTTTTTVRPRRTTRVRPTVKRATTKVTSRPLRIKVTNITTTTVKLDDDYAKPPKRPTFTSYRPDDVTYLIGVVNRKTTPVPTQNPLEVNINIQYFLPTATSTRKPYRPGYDDTVVIQRPDFTDGPLIDRPHDDYNPLPDDDYHYATKRPTYRPYQQHYYSTVRYPDYLNAQKTDGRPQFIDNLPDSFLYQGDRNFVKISSARGNEKGRGARDVTNRAEYSSELPRPFICDNLTETSDATGRTRQ